MIDGCKNVHSNGKWFFNISIQDKLNTPVKEHILKLMGFLAKANDNEVKLDLNTHIEIMFKSLTYEFTSFRATFNLGNKALTLTQLIKELQSYELMLNGGKQKAKAKKKLSKSSVPPHVDKKKTKKLKDPKKIKYFFYNRK
ncbi:hypothetical protein J1N35_005724 [Gossypium stocksii]|uniref:Uncharacterized protein n=1 Tax=Gossypium stocksii TaxID=47602 RepID=A0A9D3WDG4_9ROSI|nr:hypothetical protein J1N35_005724 [Gossypium stocksii]